MASSSNKQQQHPYRIKFMKYLHISFMTKRYSLGPAQWFLPGFFGVQSIHLWDQRLVDIPQKASIQVNLT